MQRNIVRLLNRIISIAEALVLIVALLYAVYALWDNQYIYIQASSLQNELLAFKPAETEEEKPSFDELQAINPDVCAWLSMDGTRIDFPVLRGENNWVYLSRDVYGNVSLAGSIYLDSRNAFAIDEAYSLLHGHHLDQGRMFGDLDLYKQADFFDQNTTGMLMTPETVYQLDVIAYLPVDSTDDVVFAPQRWLEDADAVLDYAEKNARYIHEETLAEARETDAKLLSLATCSSEYSAARTVILCMMTRAEAEEVSP